MNHVNNIWCCRREKVYFHVSKVEGKSWYIILFGREFWIGPERPTFLNDRK